MGSRRIYRVVCELSQVEWGLTQLYLFSRQSIPVFLEEENLKVRRLILELVCLLIVLEDCPHLKLVIELCNLSIFLNDGYVSIYFTLATSPVDFERLA